MIGELTALGAALCWTFSAMLYKKALTETKPISANVVRCAGTSLVLVLLFALLRRIHTFASLPAHVILLASISGLIGLGLGDTLYMNSLEILGVARAVPITCTYPLFSLVWAYLFAGETITLPLVVGAAAIVFGIWLLAGNEKQNKKDGNRRQIKIRSKGLVFALATAMAWSVSISMINLAVKATVGLEQAYAINTLRLVAVAVFLLALVPFGGVKRHVKSIRLKTAAILWAGGLIAIGLGWFLLTTSFIYIPESQAVPISSTTPLFSALSGVIFLREKVTIKIVIGSIMVVTGIFLIFME
ncbi:DMT family transporter [Candidatus Bathyarchaeota archaeon]|nr:DMT family transporter [Candidatus Bathyarchaeota archaeon]